MHTETITWYRTASEYGGEMPSHLLVRVKANNAQGYDVITAYHHPGPEVVGLIATSGGLRGALIPEEYVDCFATIPTGNPS